MGQREGVNLGRRALTHTTDATQMLDAEIDEKLSTLPPEIREAACRLIGAIRTPFTVDQEAYFEGKKGLDGVPD